MQLRPTNSRLINGIFSLQSTSRLTFRKSNSLQQAILVEFNVQEVIFSNRLKPIPMLTTSDREIPESKTNMSTRTKLDISCSLIKGLFQPKYITGRSIIRLNQLAVFILKP